MVAQEAEQRRPGQERGVTDRCHHRQSHRRPFRVVGCRRHAYRETQAGPHTPDRAADERQPRVAEDHQQATHDRRGEQHPEHGHPAIAVEQPGAQDAAGGHESEEDSQGKDAKCLVDVVTVDEGDRHPVVGSPLGERCGQHHDPDQQGSGLTPGRALGHGWRRSRVLDVVGRGLGGQEASGTPPDSDHGQDGDHTQVDQQRHLQPNQTGTDQCGQDGATAESGMEPGHDRLVECPFDHGAFQVLRHIPDPHTQTEQEEPRHHQEPAQLEMHRQRRQDDARRGQGQTDTDARHRTEPVGDAAGHRQTQQRSGRDRQQQDAQHARREIKDLPDIGHPRHPGREREAVHGKDEKIPVAGRDDRLRRGRRVGLLGWCSHD